MPSSASDLRRTGIVIPCNCTSYSASIVLFQNAKHAEEVQKFKKQIEDKEKIVAQHVKNLAISQHADADRNKDLMSVAVSFHFIT